MISRAGMVKVLSAFEGISITHYPKFSDDEVFCEFTFCGYKFKVSEPFGDNSVYDLLAPEGNLPEMDLIAKHFENSKPIKGGDEGHNAFFMANWLVSSSIIVGIGYAVWWGLKLAFS
jgi:hypothetical protein